MSWSSLFADDEKLGKKDDDHRLSSHTQPAIWPVRKAGQTLKRRRILYLLCGAIFIFLFIKNLPTDIGPRPRWADTRIYQGPKGEPVPSPPSANTPVPVEPSTKPPRPKSPPETFDHYHDGPIKFYRLAASLHAVAKLGGQRDHNQNVLFAVSSLKSVSELLPLACEMSRWDRNDVHFALMGRDDLEIEQVQSINGIGEEDCSIHWHDARPDYSVWSTDFRMESSVAASLEHIQTFIHPQVVLIDSSKHEDGFLVKAIREKALDLSKPLIELPSNAMENLLWITRLDSSSLAAWPKVDVEIVVQAHSRSSGSLVRLLKSLEAADYFGVKRPHITIELPSNADEAASQYLEDFVWPPVDWSGIPHTSQLTLRHRIDRRTTTPEEASARLVESFWPKRNDNSHVLLLSPQIELSPLFFHYMFYSILEYRYSQLGRSNSKYRNVIGISLHLPEYHLDDETKLTPPTSMNHKSKKNDFPGFRLPFLWQSPNDNAALYFGDKWIEFHSFLSLRLTKAPSGSPKKISRKHPAWMEFLFEFMRARGYSMLYPGAFFNDFTITTVHDELYQIPEEFAQQSEHSESKVNPTSLDTPLEGNSTWTRKSPPNIEKPLLETSLVDLLPNKADLLELNAVPLVTFDGTSQTDEDMDISALQFSDDFRRTVGGCGSGRRAPRQIHNQAVDLFCDPKEPFAYQQTIDQVNPNTPPSNPILPVDLDSVVDPDRLTVKEAVYASVEKSSHLDRQAGVSTGGFEHPEQKVVREQDRVRGKKGSHIKKEGAGTFEKDMQQDKEDASQMLSKSSQKKGSQSMTSMGDKAKTDEQGNPSTDDDVEGNRSPGW